MTPFTSHGSLVSLQSSLLDFTICSIYFNFLESLKDTSDYIYKYIYIMVAGEFQIGGDIEPLDPKTVASVVRYGRTKRSLVHEATGSSLVYSQLYPFEGLQNYTSGIIHHVRITGTVLYDYMIFMQYSSSPKLISMNIQLGFG